MTNPTVTPEMLEAGVKAMIECHERTSDEMDYAAWIEAETQHPEPYMREVYQEWMVARRLEAKAAFLAMERTRLSQEQSFRQERMKAKDGQRGRNG